MAFFYSNSMRVRVVASFLVISTIIGAGIYFTRRDRIQSDISIIGPKTIKVNELVIFLADPPNANSYAWEIVPDSRQLILGNKDTVGVTFGKPGEYYVILATSTNRKAIISKYVIMVQNGEQPLPPTPPIPPGPGPSPPTPTPPAPLPTPPQTVLSKWVSETVVTTVSGPGRLSQAVSIADQLESVCSKIAAGAIKTTREARIELRASVIEALGKDVTEWVSFSSKLSKHLEELETAGGLKDLGQYRTAYLEIADGLKRVTPVLVSQRSIVTLLVSESCGPCRMLQSQYIPKAVAEGTFDGSEIIVIDVNENRAAANAIATLGMKGRIVVPQIHIQRYINGKWLQFSKIGYTDSASTDLWVRGVFSWQLPISETKGAK